MVGVQRKPVSRGWTQFAERIVRRAGVIDDDVSDTLVAAFSAVPRTLFVGEALGVRAMEDVALPIGYGQSVPKPSTIARMLALIGLHKGMRVLEIGSGSGYCSALMATVGAQVFAMEGVGLLAQRTRRLLDSLNLHHVLVTRGDGKKGWPEHGPYDAIIVSAPIEQLEGELIRQLVPDGGRLVAPIGDVRGQILTLWETRGGSIHVYQLEPCNFAEA